MQLTLPARAGPRRLRSDRSGVALIEFAFSMPLVLFFALYGLEVGNLALANLHVSQAALNLADNASRVGLNSGLPVIQLREADINDVLEGARLSGDRLKVTERGRITLSALVRGDDGLQRIHWQRCIGLKRGAQWDSHYGTAPLAAGTDGSPANKGALRPLGMGPLGSEVNAPPMSGVMFVELNYEYQPLIGLSWLGNDRKHLQYIASFIVRDRRDFSQIYNPAPAAVRYTCDKYTAK